MFSEAKIISIFCIVDDMLKACTDIEETTNDSSGRKQHIWR